MNLFANISSDELQQWLLIITAATGMVTAFGTAIAAVISAIRGQRIIAGQEEAKKEASEAKIEARAARVEVGEHARRFETKTDEQTKQIIKSTEEKIAKVEEKAEEVKKNTEEVKRLVNGPLDQALKKNAELTQFKADVTGRSEDRFEAAVSKTIADSHSQSVYPAHEKEEGA